MNYKRGKKSARPGSVGLRFGSYFSAAKLPAVPAVFGQPWLARPGMYGNDDCGDCVTVSGVNGTLLLRAESGLSPVTFRTQDVIADYAAVSGYVIGNPATDSGLDLQQGAAYRQKTGLLDAAGMRHKIGPYVALKVGDISELLLAGFLLGACDVGVQLPSIAENQFDAGEVWDSVPDTKDGGHCIEFVGVNSRGNLLFYTWGRLQAATPGWLRDTMDEGIVYISQERLSAKGVSPQDYNAAALADDFKQLTVTA